MDMENDNWAQTMFVVAAQIDEWVDLGVPAARIADLIREKALAYGGEWIRYDENPVWGWGR